VTLSKIGFMPRATVYVGIQCRDLIFNPSQPPDSGDGLWTGEEINNYSCLRCNFRLRSPPLAINNVVGVSPLAMNNV